MPEQAPASGIPTADRHRNSPLVAGAEPASITAVPYTYTIEDRIVHLAWSGVVAKEDLQAIGREMPRLAAELGFAPDVLHTFDAVAGYSFQPIAAYALSLLRKRVVIPYPVRSAAVARTPESLALSLIHI